MYKKQTYLAGIVTVALLCLSGLFASSVSAAVTPPLKVNITGKSINYLPGDILKISWSPATTPIQTIKLVPAGGGGGDYYIYSDIGTGDPAITSGSIEFKITDFFVPKGSYYVSITPLDSSVGAVLSAKPIKIENRPSLLFHSASGEVNSMATSSGKTVTLVWKADGAKNCKASSYPKNSKWKSTVKASGTKKIRVFEPTTFYITCKHTLGDLSGTLKVNILNTSKKTNVLLIPSVYSKTLNYKLGTYLNSQQIIDQAMTVTNSSPTETIYLRQVIKDQPAWINSSFNTAQMALGPKGIMGVGGMADPYFINKPGTYKWNYILEGNFSNSPLIIPITMNILQ